MSQTHTHQQRADEHSAHEHAAHHHNAAADDDYTDLLDLDALVLADYWSAALDWIRESASGAARARLLDLGAGTGAGALGLARRYPDAQVVALDVSPVGLARIRAKADGLGLGGRVRTVEADLDTGWPDLGWPASDGPTPIDLTWASMSLHHMADPAAVLRGALAATRPGGLIAVAEFSQPLRFLPDGFPVGDPGVGRPGFEDRVLDLLGRAHAQDMPTLGSQWAPRLADAGWTVVAERDFQIDHNSPSHPDAPRYARSWFTRLSEGRPDQLDADDQATLTRLLDDGSPHSRLRHANLHIRGIRTITLARRD